MSRELGTPIAAGQEAEIFAWGDRVLKLSKRVGDPTQAQREAATLVALAPLSLAPVTDGVIEIEGRWGVVMERIDLPVLAGALADPARVGAVLALMVMLHRRIHAVAAPAGVPELKQRMAGRIGQVERLEAGLREDLLARLAAMPDGDRLCHGDFHPFNILGLDEGARVIDWLDATRGDPAADVCRTFVLISPHEPALARAHVDAYLAASEVSQAAVEAWLPFVAAARLAENVPDEVDRLAELARGQRLG